MFLSKIFFVVPGPEIPSPTQNTPEIQDVNFKVEFLGKELDSDSALTALNVLFGVSIALACMFVLAVVVLGK